MRYLDELRALNLPPEEYVVFGSGPLAIRNIRENGDIDIIVSEKLWKILVKQHNVAEDVGDFKIDHIEVARNWKPWFAHVTKLLDDADEKDGIRYVKLKYLIEWQALRNSAKDIDDLEKVRMYIDLYGDGMTPAFK